jgi:hypothetical protein
MTRMGERWGLPAVAVLAFLAAAFSYLPAGYALRYATVGVFSRPASWSLGLLAAIPVVALHEWAVRGLLYPRVRRGVRAGFGAPAVALAGALVPVGVRWVLFPFPAVPAWLVLGQSVFVEYPVSLALCLLALGTDGWRTGAAALFLLWAGRVLVVPTFRGAPVPILEVLAALLVPLVVALVLHRPLAPHREALEGLS